MVNLNGFLVVQLVNYSLLKMSPGYVVPRQRVSDLQACFHLQILHMATSRAQALSSTMGLSLDISSRIDSI